LAGETLNFSGAGSSDNDGTIANYRWDFGDGTSANSVQVSKQYAEANTYQVTLTVTDNDGATAQAAHAVQISQANQLPQARISGPATGFVGEALNFSGAGSTDNDGTIANYHWTFGDGTSANGVEVSKHYAEANTYQVTLTVTDNDGATAQATHAVQITQANQLPQAKISGPATGFVGEALNFSGAGSSDNDGTIVNYHWTFGDGTSANGVEVSKHYAEANIYQITLVVVDNDGSPARAAHKVQIDEIITIDLPPTVILSGPASAEVNQVVEFDSSGSFDPEGTALTLIWDFGDGTSAEGELAIHVYQQPGEYTVSLTATDSTGLSNDATHQIAVTVPGDNKVVDDEKALVP
jgi:PKD repeat protein